MSKNKPTKRIRIERIELQNFRGVSHGIVEFNCLKSPREKDTLADVLGIYGQNGSGKTTLLEALHIAKLAMMGSKIPYSKYGNIIAQGADSARMILTFQVGNDDGADYHLEYAFSLGTWEYLADDKVGLWKEADKSALKLSKSAKLSASLIRSVGSAAFMASTVAGLPGALVAGGIGIAGIVAGQILNRAGSENDHYSESEGKHLAVFDEVLSLSGSFNGNDFRFGPIFDARSNDSPFLPKAKQKEFFPKKTSAALKEAQRVKSNSLINAKSFIFCDEFINLLFEQETITEYAHIILDLRAFAVKQLRVLGMELNNSVRNDAILLYTANRGVAIRRSDSTTFLDEKGLQTLTTAINGLNVVLQQVIPGLKLEAVRQVDIDNENAQNRSQGTKVTVYSVRDNVRIRLAEESAGIIRLISSLGLFSYAFVHSDVTVAIDEIDAGVYEYLLGELLLIFEEYGAGQLIFTCHNLRPMEVLSKKYIYFTTTNPENRYLKPKSIRNENNLRDVYLREIISGGQDEDLYTTAKHGKIAAALQKAGDLLGQE